MPNPRTAPSLTAVSVAAVLLTGVVGAPPALADAEEDFAITDRNSDGFIDRGEFHQRMVELFFFADADRDGRLVPAELPVVPAAVFRGADRDGNGSLSLAEFTQARAVDFGQVDRDGDGRLSRAEVDAVAAPPVPGAAQAGKTGRAAR